MGRPSKPHWHRGRLRVRIDGEEIYLAGHPNDYPSKQAYQRKALAEYHQRIASLGQLETENIPDSIDGLIIRWQRLHPTEDTRYRLRDFSVFAGHILLSEVSPDLFEEYLYYLTKRTYVPGNSKTSRKLSKKTINDRMGVAVALIRDAEHKEWISRMPIIPKRMKIVPNPRGRAPEVIKEVLECLPERARRLCEFVDATGCRTDEACRLRWEHVVQDKNGQPSVIKLPDHKTATKTSKMRVIYLTPHARNILDSITPKRGPIFKSRLDRPYKYSGILTMLKRASNKAEVYPHITPHQIRHSFAQRTSKTLPLQLVSKLLGHRDVSQTQRYYYVEDEQALEAAKSLESSMQVPSLDEPDASTGDSVSSESQREGRTSRKGGKGRSARGTAKQRRA